ncbi:MAG: hypothetical protein KA716_28410 [Gloeotrichia echinulata DEX184]|nr:hypothetical protein [Gloeotrichia echinulata DEX184]
MSFPEIQTLTLTINLSKPMGDDALVQWQVWDGKKWQDQETTDETVVRQNIVTNEPLKLSWEYWNNKDWINLIVQDDSENLTRSGLVEFILPTDIEKYEDFGQSARYWLRIRWESGDYDLEPRLRRILLNTTIASQTVTISNEILGSSDGTQNQTFRTTRSPVLEGEYLEVQEPEMPSATEQESIKKIYGEEGFTVMTDRNEQPKEIWVRWCEVPDFYGSGFARSPLCH